MSTRHSLIYAEGTHIYIELLDGRVWVEMSKGELELNMPLCSAKVWRDYLAQEIERSTEIRNLKEQIKAMGNTVSMPSAQNPNYIPPETTLTTSGDGGLYTVIPRVDNGSITGGKE